MALGDVPGRNDGQAQVRQGDRRAFGDGLQRHSDVIRRVDVDGERHKQWLLYHMISNNNRAARLACRPDVCYSGGGPPGRRLSITLQKGEPNMKTAMNKTKTALWRVVLL